MPVRSAMFAALLLACPLPVALAAGTSAHAHGPAPGHAPSAASAGCEGFTRDVSLELAAMQAPGTAGVAGTGAQDGAMPRLEPGVRHDVRLHPHAGVVLAATPARAVPGDASAGLLAFRVPVAGRYRVSLTTAHRVDVVDAGTVLASRDHQGVRGCPLLRKVVEFDLPAGRDLVLQLVGNAGTAAGVLVTVPDGAGSASPAAL